MSDEWKDLEDLFPGSQFKIGDHTIDIKPFGLEHLQAITGWVAKVKDELMGLDWERLDSALPRLSALIVKDGGYLISLATQIPEPILAKLPLKVLSQLAFEVTNVNLLAKDGLEKNWLESLLLVATQLKESVLGK